MMLTLLMMICSGLTRGTAQLSNTKRVTSVQLGEAPEGARVTIVSDAAMNDYEAFRRGDRFYVRVPFADFAAAQPNFRGDGFDDVQVQKVGDSVVISFKLQPGATARVDQRANRLDVIFSAPQRISRNTGASLSRERIASSPVGSIRSTRSPSVGSRKLDTVGPLPPDSPQDYQTGRTGQTSARETGVRPDYRRPGQTTPGLASSKQSTSSTTSATLPGTPSPNPSVTSPYTASNTTASSTTPRPASSSSAPNLNGRRQRLIQWVSANRSTVLLGTLGLLGLITLIALVRYSRQMNAPKAKHSKSPGVQPKFSPATEWEDLLADPFDVPSSKTQTLEYVDETKSDPWQSGSHPVPVAVSDSSPASVEESLDEQTGRITAPNLAPVRGTSAKDPEWVLPKSSIGAPIFNHQEIHSENQEREVFEL
jgi:hypothetical protein